MKEQVEAAGIAECSEVVATGTGRLLLCTGVFE